ncbi:hypothetical protein MXB_269 [Myxobolus squamalis]|nr:hypothetical protein MXB_269 [Myxobolus squamalis]
MDYLDYGSLIILSWFCKDFVSSLGKNMNLIVATAKECTEGVKCIETVSKLSHVEMLNIINMLIEFHLVVFGITVLFHSCYLSILSHREFIVSFFLLIFSVL